MAIVKYTAVHTTPKAHLKYILNPNKNEDLKYATALNTSADYELAYEGFKEIYEHFSGEIFNISEKSGSKKHVRIHSYIQSFNDDISPQKAHMIGVEWAREMFGENRPVVISTHVNTGHVHNHIAVCPYDLDGKRWISNMKTLTLGRQISDRIIKARGLSVIENPRQKNNLSYAEWLAKNNVTSWKSKMADNIDRFIISKDVTDINSLILKMQSEGYIFTDENKLIAKPASIKYGCRLDKLGLGYSRETLQMRIDNKHLEMVGRKISRYRGFQIDIAVCFKQTQYDFYRIKDEKNCKTSYAELKRNADLLTFICNNNIHSKKEFADYVDYLDDREKELSKIMEYSSYGGIYNGNAFETVIKNREKNKSELEKIKAEKRIAAANYKVYLNLMESDYERILKQEKNKREIELYRQGYEISQKGEPYKDFNEIILRMSKWADMVQEKAAVSKAQERRYISR
ncbi:MAG: relaxase/mobilization nuclease domain-containing protein [Ruminococcus sp.]|nr:relaxase/mobilization nuclease domain-containing protein [Ruminococcus sp.]MCM1381829.1 relaxase/mobilization nuclease domain-containing protein [Muribaculaceae bacterium]MCM1479438.1 relaxase/mobilization nuclease domain-containing protein [Muribaculaceae bacterium]